MEKENSITNRVKQISEELLGQNNINQASTEFSTY